MLGSFCSSFHLTPPSDWSAEESSLALARSWSEEDLLTRLENLPLPVDLPFLLSVDEAGSTDVSWTQIFIDSYFAQIYYLPLEQSSFLQNIQLRFELCSTLAEDKLKNFVDTVVVVVVEVGSVAAAVAAVGIAVAVAVDGLDTVDVEDTALVPTSCTPPGPQLAWGWSWAGACVVTSDPWSSDSHWRTWRGARVGA